MLKPEMVHANAAAVKGDAMNLTVTFEDLGPLMLSF